MTKVYFYARDAAAAYHDDIVVLADGLQQLGVEVYGNINYWKRSPEKNDWLLRHDPNIGPSDCDIVAVSYIWSRWINLEFEIDEQSLPAGLFAPKRTYKTAYLDLDDGYKTCSWQAPYRDFDVVFRAKYNHRCFHPDNHHPWALGINHRMLECTLAPLNWSERNNDLLVNFNASHPYLHGARAAVGPRFIQSAKSSFNINETKDDLTVPPQGDWDKLMWQQTQHRHSRSYYDRLCNSKAIVAFCGEFIPPTPRFPGYLAGGNKARLNRLFHNILAKFSRRPPRLIQWDSWRFWEGLAAGCLVFNLDLEYYGIKLPVMPKKWEHYIGVHPGNIDESFDRLRAHPKLAEKIARQGRNWALAHYTPKPLAQRFLDKLSP